MSKITPLPIPDFCRSVDQALGAAKNANLDNIVILSETDRGVVLISAGGDGLLTSAQVMWLLQKGSHLLLSPSSYEMKK